MNCSVTLTNTNTGEKVEIKPLNMWSDLEVEAKGSVTLSYTANFETCRNKGYTELDNEVSGKKIRNCIDTAISPPTLQVISFRKNCGQRSYRVVLGHNAQRTERLLRR